MRLKFRKPFIVDIAGRIHALLTGRQRKQAWLMVILNFLEGLLEIIGLASIIPYVLMVVDPGMFENNPYVKQLFEAMPVESKNGFLVLVLMGILLLFILKNGIALLIEYRRAAFAYDVATELSDRQARYYLSRDFLYHLRTSNHEVVNKAKTIPFMFGNGVLLRFIILVGDILLAFIILGTILYVNAWIFMALALILTPLIFTGYNQTKHRVKKLGERKNSYQPVANAGIYRVSQAFPIIKLYNKEQFFKERFVHYQDKIHQIQAKIHTYNAFARKFMEVNAILGILVISVYTFFIGMKGEQLFLFLSIYATASYKLIPSLSRIFDSILTIRGHQYAIQALEARQPEEVHSPSAKVKPEAEKIPFAHSVQLNSVEFTYPGAAEKTLKGIDLTIPCGHIVGIAGKSGEGKSTLLYILMQLIIQDKGSLFIDNGEVNEGNRQLWQKKLGLVWHDNFILNAGLAENIAFAEKPENIDRDKLWKVVNQTGLTDFVEKLPKGLDTVMEEDGRSLSAGQQQRIAIARALYQDASMLLFDEPTNALDKDSETVILKAVKALKNEGKTIVMISHRFSTLKICDQIYELANGKLSRPYDYATFSREHQESHFLEEAL